MDDTDMKEKKYPTGIGGMVSALVMLDIHTKTRYGFPIKSYTTNEHVRKMEQFVGGRGSDKCALMYSDNHTSLIKACEEFKYPHDLAQPGRPDRNGIAEQAVSDILTGTRTALIQAGLPGCLWPAAMECYSTLDNARKRGQHQSLDEKVRKAVQRPESTLRRWNLLQTSGDQRRST